MKSKLLFKSLLMLLLIMISLSARSDDNSNQSTNKHSNGTAILNIQVDEQRIKRMPCKYVLEIQYSDGVLSLFSNYYEGEFSLTLNNIETGESYEIPLLAVGESICIDLEVGEYHVSAVNSMSLLFEGIMELEKY